MQGTISFDGTLSGGITGGGGGSNVEITPTLQSGTKIADFTIDEESGSLYAPDTGSDVTITPTVQTGTKIADYTIDGDSGSIYAPTPETLPSTIVTKALRKYNDNTQTKIMTITTLDTENDQEVSQDIYAPSPVQCWYNPGLEQDYQIGQFTYGEVTQNVYIPYFQRPLTAGTNITIDPITNVISASGGSSAINYSTTEQDTGITWIDGRHIYQLSIVCDRQYQMSTTGYVLGQVINELASADCIIDIFGIMLTTKKFVQFDSADITVVSNVNKLRVYSPKAQTFNIGDVITIKYLKVVTP